MTEKGDNCSAWYFPANKWKAWPGTQTTYFLDYYSQMPSDCIRQGCWVENIHLSVHLSGALMLYRAHRDWTEASDRGLEGPGLVSGYFDPKFPLGEHSKWVLPEWDLYPTDKHF